MRLPSFKLVKLLLFMLDNRFVTFKDQQIYKNQRSFKRALKILISKDLVGYRIFHREQYFLKRRGIVFARLLKEYAN